MRADVAWKVSSNAESVTWTRQKEIVGDLQVRVLDLGPVDIWG